MTRAELYKLTPLAKRIQIAQFCGWSHLRWAGGTLWGTEPGYNTPDWNAGCEGDGTHVPEYLHSIDAMFAAEEIAISQDYGPLLAEALDGNWHATASQRADALLLTI